MAVRLIDVYPSNQVNPGSVEYPGGSGKNVSAPGQNDGTPFDEIWFNDIQGLLAALLEQAGLTANGDPETAQDSQYVEAIKAVSLAATQPLVRAPLNVTPADGGSIGTTTPTLITDDYQALYDRTHLASEYRIGTSIDNGDVTDIVGVSGVLGAVTQWVVAPALATGDDYYWQARYQNEDELWSEWGIPTVTTLPSLSVQTPTNLLPLDSASDITDIQTFTGDAFALIPPGGEDHVASQWQITTDINFVTIDFDSGEDAVNLLSFTQAGLALNLTTYYWRVRYKDGTFGWSDYSTPFNFVTVTEAVQQPTNLTPTNGTVDVGASVQLTADAFTPIGSAQTHDASQWQAGNSDFSTIYFDSGVDAINLETINITGYPEATTTVFWRVRYQGSVTGFSAYSNPFTFVTKALFIDWLNWDGTSDGLEVTVNASGPQDAAFERTVDVCNIDTDKQLVCYQLNSGTSVFATVMTTSGLTVTNENTTSLAMAAAVDVRCESFDTDKALVVMAPNSGSNITAAIVTTTGTTPAFSVGITVASDMSLSNKYVAIVPLDTTRVALCYTDTSNDLVCKIILVSGANPSPQTADTFSGPQNLNVKDVALLESDKIVIVMTEGVTDNVATMICNFSGSTSTLSAVLTTQGTLVGGVAQGLTISKTKSGAFSYVAQRTTSLSISKATYAVDTITLGATSTGTSGNDSGQKLDLLNPEDDVLMFLTGKNAVTDEIFVQPIDDTTPAFETEIDEGAVNSGAGSGFAIIDGGRIAFVRSTPDIKMKVLNGEP